MAAQVALRRDEEEVPGENGLARNAGSPSNLPIEALNQDTVSSSTEKGGSLLFLEISNSFRY